MADTARCRSASGLWCYLIVEMRYEMQTDGISHSIRPAASPSGLHPRTLSGERVGFFTSVGCFLALLTPAESLQSSVPSCTAVCARCGRLRVYSGPPNQLALQGRPPRCSLQGLERQSDRLCNLAVVTNLSLESVPARKGRKREVLHAALRTNLNHHTVLRDMPEARSNRPHDISLGRLVGTLARKKVVNRED